MSPVLWGRAGHHQSSTTGAGIPGRLLARAAVGAGGQGALRALASWEARRWPHSSSRGLPLPQTPACVVLSGWEARQRRLGEFVPLKWASWVLSLLAAGTRDVLRCLSGRAAFDTEDFDIRHVPLTPEGFGQVPGRPA